MFLERINIVMKTAKIHSIETCGTVDGPGIRFVAFFQGCPLRCKYCHNPDTWKYSEGKEITIDELFDEIKKYKPYMKFSGGGVTISGGEPLLQIDFLKELFIKCKNENIHTAIDTSGVIFNDKVKEVLEYTDLVLLDIKSYNRETFKNLTGGDLNNTLLFADYLSNHNIVMWVRFVLVPNLTDNIEDINKLADYLKTLKSVERVDVLPFHKMGEYKWKELGYEYSLEQTQSPNADLLEKVKQIFRLRGLLTP